MITHHLKIAFRNLWKYKTQNIISIIGLAIGFTCFAFSALWYRYEMSYDSFHPKADRIYQVKMAKFKWNPDEIGRSEETELRTPYPLVNWLKSNFPEIEDASGIAWQLFPEHLTLNIDYSFSNIFDLPLPEDFFVEGRTDRPVIVTEDLKEKAEFIKERFNLDVYMSIPSWPANTNFPFKMITPLRSPNHWLAETVRTYVLLKDGVDVKVLEKKLDKVEIPEWQVPVSFELLQLKHLRHNNPIGVIQPDFRINHLKIFTLAGLLVILCSLFNHLTLYVTRVRMRLHELALRKVNGATDWQIAATLYTDFLLVIVLSLVAGLILMSSLLPIFKEYATIGSNNINIYSELAFYTVLLIVCGFIAGGVPFLYFRKQVLNESIKGTGSPGSRYLFRKGSLLVQLIISLGMIFCTAVFIKQINFLYQTGLGINRHNIATVEPPPYNQLPPQYVDRIKQVPGVIDAIPVRGASFLRNMTMPNYRVTIDIEKDGQKIKYSYYLLYADARFFDFFGIDIIEGMGHSNETNNKLVINETMLQDLGREIISAQLDVIGVARDFYLTPTQKAQPIAILYPGERFFTTIAYKYEEGFRHQIEEVTEKMIREDFPEHESREIYRHYMEEIFEEHFKSERALLVLLSVMTLACSLIAVFGVYSLTSLTCQQRRKEIAIRKINGAEVIDIMTIFFKEYLVLLAIAAFVAFPAGYVIMKRWMEGYVKQTSMDAWLFMLIFLIVFVVIVFSIISMVWKAANQNPAEVVKSE